MRTIKFTFIVFLLGLFTLPSVATDFYWWKYAPNGNFSNASNWVTNPAEVAVSNPTSIPGSYPQNTTDNVFFTVESANTTLIVSAANAVMGNLTCTAPVVYTFSTDKTYSINGNIQSNGNLRFSTGTISMVGSTAATIDLGTSSSIVFGTNFIINKSGARVDLINNDFIRTNTFTLTAGNFYSNGKNITASTVTFSVLPADNLAGSTLNLTNAAGTSSFSVNGLYNCDVVSANATLNTANIQFKTLTLNHASGVTIGPNSATANTLSVVDLIVNTPVLNFARITQWAIDAKYTSISVSDTLTLQQASSITVNLNSYGLTTPCAFNVNGIKIVPTACDQRSSLTGYSPVTLKITGNPVTTSGLLYKNITFDAAGATVTASAGDDGGQNSGNVVWTTLTPQDFYWIGGTGNWNVAANWAMGSFGGTPATCSPTAIDNVFFGDNGGSAYTVTMRSSKTCNNITWTDANKNGTLAASTGVSLSIKGNADFSGANQINPILYFLGNDPAGSYTVNSGSTAVYTNEIYFQHQGTYTLTSDFRITNRAAFYHTAGTLVSAGYTLLTGRFGSYYAYPSGATRILNLAGSEIHCAQPNATNNTQAAYLSTTGLSSYNFSDSHFILELNNATGTLQTAGTFNFNRITTNSNITGKLAFSSSSTTVDTLTFLGNGVMDGNACNSFSVNVLVLSRNCTYTLPNRNTSAADRTITINDTILSTSSECIGLTISGTSTVKGIIKNNTAHSLTIPGAVVSNTIYTSGSDATPLYVPGGTDNGGNTNVDVEESDAQIWYWVGNSGNWSDPTHWSLIPNDIFPSTSNSGGCIPGRQDTVYFNGNSFTSNNQTVTCNINFNIASMFWTPEAGAKKPVLQFGGRTINLSGSLTLAAGMTTAGSAGSFLNFTGKNTAENSQVIESNGILLTNATVNISGSGRFDLNGNLERNTSTAPQFTFTGGSLYTHGYSIAFGTMTITQSAASNYIDVSNSLINAGGGGLSMTIKDCTNFIKNNTRLYSAGNVTITNSCPVSFNTIQLINSSTLTTSASQKVTANTITMGNSTGSGTINGLIETNTLNFYNNLTITAGRTVTVNNVLNALSGTPCAKVVLSGSSSSQATLVFGYCNPEIYNLDLRNINIVLPDPSVCNNVPQNLTVYGADFGGNTGNIIYDTSLGTGVSVLPDLHSTCLPYQLDLTKGNVQSYQWKKDGVNIPAINGGTSRVLTVNEAGTYQLVATYAAACVSTMQQTIDFIMPERHWTGAVSTNWQDTLNWQEHSLPDACSHVIIPGGLVNYPILADDNPKCDVIEFLFGGEAQNTQYLTYSEAWAELEVNSNQWYMLSASLKDTYSGDYYEDDHNPHLDHGGNGMLVHMMHFNIENYQTYATKIDYNWNNGFNTNDILIQPGQGFALFANPKNTDYTDNDPMIFPFPKDDEFHYYYSILGAVTGRGANLDRTRYGRFIYEDANGNIPADSLIVLNHSGYDAIGKPVLVGNPFMTHIDFDKFQARNVAFIENEYKIAYGDPGTADGSFGGFGTYKMVAETPITTDIDPSPSIDATLNSLIPPMQSFLVISKTATNDDLKVHIKNDTQNAPQGSNTVTLRSKQNHTALPQLHITATRDKQKSKAVLALWEEAGKNYQPAEDSRRLFDNAATAPLTLYLLSQDGFALDINTTDRLDENTLVKIGIRTSKIGRILLNFSGMEDFANTKIYLHDAVENMKIDLSEQSEYAYIKYDSNLYTDDRFYLTFEDVTGIKDFNGLKDFQVTSPVPQTIRITSHSGNSLGNLEIIDTQGRTLVKENTVKPVYNCQANATGVYIVRVNGETKKIIVK